MSKQKGYTDENGEYHEPMTKAEAKASIEDMKKFVEIIDMGQKAKDEDIYVFDLEKLKRVTPEIKDIIEKNFPREFYGDDILIYEAWDLRSLFGVMMLMAVEQSKKVSSGHL